MRVYGTTSGGGEEPGEGVAPKQVRLVTNSSGATAYTGRDVYKLCDPTVASTITLAGGIIGGDDDGNWVATFANYTDGDISIDLNVTIINLDGSGDLLQFGLISGPVAAAAGALNVALEGFSAITTVGTSATVAGTEISLDSQNNFAVYVSVTITPA